MNYINTGRVLIGSAYQPPPNRMEGDAIKLQSALLKAKRRVSMWRRALNLFKGLV